MRRLALLALLPVTAGAFLVLQSGAGADGPIAGPRGEVWVITPAARQHIDLGATDVPVKVIVRKMPRVIRDLDASVVDGSGKATPLNLDRNDDKTYKLIDGWEAEFDGHFDASKLPPGTGSIKVEAPALKLFEPAYGDFMIGAPDALIDLIAQRLDPLGLTNQTSPLFIWDWSHVHVAIGDAAALYVNPETGRAWSVYDGNPADNILRALFGRPDWLPDSAPTQDRIDEARTVLQALQWRAVGPSEIRALIKRASGSYPYQQSQPDDCKSQVPAQGPSLFGQAEAATATVEYGTAGTVLGGGGGSIGLEIRRDYWDLPMPQPGAGGGPAFPVDDARLLLASGGSGASDGVGGAITLARRDGAWTLGPADWVLAQPAIAVGTSSAGPTVVTDRFAIPASAILASDNSDAKPRLSDHVVIGVAGPEPPPGFPGSNSCFFARYVDAEGGAPYPELIYHQRFPAVPAPGPVLSVSPVSQDASTGTVTDSGALNFGNVAVGGQRTETATVTNTGGRQLRITGLRPNDNAYSLVDSPGACKADQTALAPNESCTVTVKLTAPRGRQLPSSGAILITDNAPPHGEHRIALFATATRTQLAYETASPYEGLHEFPDCSRFRKLGWTLLPGPQPTAAAGSVLQSHVASEDSGTNHKNADFNWFVYPDHDYRLLLTYPGNWKTGDSYEYGRLEVEWERFSREWPGIPVYAWPTQGDRVFMVGQHPFDCGHADEGHRAEIHPPQFVATWRNAVLERLAARGPLAGVEPRLGSYLPGPDTAATRVDLYASSFGGGAIGSQHLLDPEKDWYQPVEDLDYQFIVRAPPRPTSDAELAFRAQKMGGGNDSHVQIDVLPLPGGESYLVTLPMRDLRRGSHPNEKLFSGWRFWAYWKGDDVPRLPLRRYTVTFQTLKINDDLTGRWSGYEYVNELAGGSVLTGNGPNVNHERFKHVDKGPVGLNDSFTATLVPGQPLRVAFRGSAWTQLGTTGGSQYPGMAEEVWADPGDVTTTLHSTDELAIGGHEENACEHRSCFDVTVRIDKH